MGEEWRQTEERTRCFRREKREDLVKNGIIYELVHSILSSNFYVVNRVDLTMLSSFLTVQTLVRDCQVIRETKENQIAELKKICEQSAESLNNDWEKKVSYVK